MAEVSREDIANSIDDITVEFINFLKRIQKTKKKNKK